MQQGAFKINGKYWWVKWRERVIKNGVIESRDHYKKLCLVADYRPRQDGSAPDSVRAMAVKYLAPINSGESTPLSADKLSTFLESFLAKGEGGRGRKLDSNTLRNYQDLFKIAKPHLPDIELRQVRTPHIDKLLRDIVEADDAAGGRRAHTTYRNLKNSFLNSAFKYAARQGLTEVNPVRDAAIPEGKETDTYAYSLEQFHKMIKALDAEGEDKNHTAEAALFVLMFTGLRMEELKGLRWEDYDAKAGILDIKRAVVEGEIKEVKTKSSKAPVPVVKIVADKLAEHLKRNSGGGFIFHGDTDEPLRFENLSRRDITPALEKHRIEWHGFHAFRRGLSTELAAVGTPDSIADRITRHSPKDNDTRRKHYVKSNSLQVLNNSRTWLEKVEQRYIQITKKKRR